MMASKLIDQAAILLALLWIGGTALFLPSVMGQPPTSEKKGDKDKLQGKWQIMSIAVQGKVFKREDNLNAWKDTFDNDVSIQGDRLIHSQGTNEGKFKLDGARDPRQITFHDKDGKLTFRGIYVIDGDTLTVCINGDGTDVRRPEEFVTKEGTPFLLIALKKRPAKK